LPPAATETAATETAATETAATETAATETAATETAATETAAPLAYVVAEGRQIVAPSGQYLNAGDRVTAETYGESVFLDLIARGILVGVAG